MNADSINPLLLAEDSEDDAFLMKRAYGKANFVHPLKIVYNGKEVTEYLGGEGSYSDRQIHPFPLLLLLDLKMPVMNGFEVLEWIRNRKTLNGLVVIILSSSSNELDIKRAYDLGANCYITKPSSFEELIAMLARLREFWFTYNRWPDSVR